MRRYFAKPIRLKTCKECSNRTCNCYTNSGYYVMYTNSKCSSLLFVCEDCYKKLYRFNCIIRDFPINDKEVISTAGEQDTPLLRSIIRLFNKTMKNIKYVLVPCMVAVMFFVLAFTGEYKIRDDYEGIAVNAKETVVSIKSNLKYIAAKVEDIVDYTRSLP